MAKQLKGVIIGMRNVAFAQGDVDWQKLAEVARLLEFLLTRNIKPVIFGNQDWLIGNPNTQTQRRLQDVLQGVWTQVEWIIANRDHTPHKPTREAVQYILRRFGWDVAEVVFLGNTEDDMQTAVNSRVLFLNAIWYGRNSEYGFFFESPLHVARFIDTFCLREHLWHYTIERPDLRYYALAPYSTLIQEFAVLSTDAKAAAKWGGGHPDFWTKYLWSTIYFSELFKEIDYIAAYPGHAAGASQSVLETPMSAFGRCFRKTYLRDLIVRHTTSQKSSAARNRGVAIDHRNQLNSIQLTALPLRDEATRYKNCPINKGKTVLVIDDICTNGYSLEAARCYLEQAGAKVICLSWLKTINSDYVQMGAVGKFNPFQPNTFAAAPATRRYPYRDFIADQFAPEEVAAKLAAYDRWNWP